MAKSHKLCTMRRISRTEHYCVGIGDPEDEAKERVEILGPLFFLKNSHSNMRICEKEHI